jgi:drug/metabolite transporter (DMT)-like permease
VGENVGLFLLYAIASGLGLTFLKQGLPPDIFNVKGIAVLGCALYVASFGIWLRIMTRNDITVAYPIGFARGY